MNLKEQLENSKIKLEKRLNTITKLCKKLDVNQDALLSLYNNKKDKSYKEYYFKRKDAEEIVYSLQQEKPIRDEHNNWLEDNYSFNYQLSNLIDNLSKLYEVEQTTHNWQVKYDKEQNKLNVEKIPAIWNFLTDWENKTIEWYKLNAKKYYELKCNEKSSLIAYLESDKFKKEVEDIMNMYKGNRLLQTVEYKLERQFLENYYFSIDNFTKLITSFKKDYETYTVVSYTVDEERLLKAVAKEKLDKYFDLVNRVTQVVGEIKDASNLRIGNQKGELNGVIKGEKGSVRVETISAGGYNIQKFHYRVLIH